MEATKSTTAGDLPAIERADIEGLIVIPLWAEEGPSAAAILRWSRAHAYRMSKRGLLPTLRAGGRVMVPVRPLLAWIDGEDQ